METKSFEKWELTLEKLEAFARDRISPEQQELRSRHLSKIYPQLYVGDYKAAQNVSLLREKQIQAVVRIHQEEPSSSLLESYAAANIRHLYLKLADSHDAPIRHHFNTSSEFISTQLPQGGVLVH